MKPFRGRAKFSARVGVENPGATPLPCPGAPTVPDRAGGPEVSRGETPPGGAAHWRARGGASLARSPGRGAGSQDGQTVGAGAGRGLPEGSRREEGREEEEAGRRARRTRVEEFLRGRRPLACRAVPRVRCCWKAGSTHIPRRFSRHLTRRGGDGGGGRGRGAGRHHPPQRTHSRARGALEAGPPPAGGSWARAGGGDASFQGAAAGRRRRSQRGPPPAGCTRPCRPVQSISSRKGLHSKAGGRASPRGRWAVLVHQVGIVPLGLQGHQVSV